MALIKLEEKPGYSAEYHIISEVTIHQNGRTEAIVSTEPHKDKETRDLTRGTGAYANGFSTYHFDVSDASKEMIEINGQTLSIEDGIIHLGYEMLKKQALIEEAKDDDDHTKQFDLAEFAQAEDEI